MIKYSILMVFTLSLFVLVGCVSKGPSTRFYSLFPVSNTEKSVAFEPALGVGPIVLPEYLERPSVVSLTASQRIRIASHDVWAGDFRDSVTRVIAGNLALIFDSDKVWGFPWDNRVRPEHQVRVVFSQLSGERGGDVYLAAKWSLLSEYGNSLLATGGIQLSAAASNDSAEAYVATLNRLLNAFSEQLASDVAAQL